MGHALAETVQIIPCALLEEVDIAPMTRSSLPPRDFLRARRAAFTLIELLTVIAIILVLAGLLLHIAGNANTKASLSKAQAEIQAMSSALEHYYADNGTYPRNSDTDILNAQPASGSAPPDPSTYKNAGYYLYQVLSGYGTNAAGAPNKAYMPFTPGQLSTGNAAPTTSTYIIDPFGIPYGYSTARLLAQDNANAQTTQTAPDPTKGYNPTFDLWSTGGYGTGGKAYPAGVINSNQITLWVKNW